MKHWMGWGTVAILIFTAILAGHGVAAQQQAPEYGITTRANVSATGQQTTQYFSAEGVISRDGRWVAFHTSDRSLIPDDTNDDRDIYIHDTTNRTIERVSVRSDGTPLDAPSSMPSLSREGRWVAFLSQGLLTPQEEPIYLNQVLVRDRATGTTSRLSQTTAGEPANGWCEITSRAISDDGQTVVFHSRATNLVQPDTNEGYDIFLYNQATDTLTRLSNGVDGTEANGESKHARISGDGRYVVFDSLANNLVIGDTNIVTDTFFLDMQTGILELVSRNSEGIQANGAAKFPTLSADGRYVAFVSNATNLHPGATDGLWYLYRHDRITGETVLVSQTAEGVITPTFVEAAEMSDDGRWIAFSSGFGLVPEDNNGKSDIFRKDMLSGLVARLSVDSYNQEGDGDSNLPTLSADGMQVAWESRATNLVIDDTNNNLDIFVRRRVDGPVPTPSPSPTPQFVYGPLVNGGEIWTRWEPGATRITGTANGNSWGASVDERGKQVAFVSDANNFGVVDGNGVADVYLWHRRNDEFERVSVSSDGTEANGGSDSAELSIDGRYVVFVSHANNLVANDNNGEADVFRHNVLTGETVLVSVGLDGTSANAASHAPDSSADGRWIVFTSEATNLTTTPYPADCTPGPCRTIYRRDMEAGITETLVRNADGTAAVPLAEPSISNDGQMVAYGWEQFAGANPPGDRFYDTSIYRFNATTGMNTLVSSANENFPNGHCLLPVCGHVYQGTPRISGDGSAVGFFRVHYASSQYGGSEDQGITVLGSPYSARVYNISEDSVGCLTLTQLQGDTDVTDVGLSNNGAIRVFAADDLNRMDEKPCGITSTPHFPDDGNAVKDIYFYIAYPQPDGTTSIDWRRVSANDGGGVGDGESKDVAISDDGFTVAYTTQASNVALGDENGGIHDIVVWSWK
jgi:Tol biopolymer transport system component